MSDKIHSLQILEADRLSESKRIAQVGVAFAFLNETLSESHFDLKDDSSLRGYSISELRSEQVNALRFIIDNTTPTELPQIIFDNPPKTYYKDKDSDAILYVQPIIEVIEPSGSDLEYAEKNITFSREEISEIDKNLPEGLRGKGLVENFIKNLNREVKYYLNAPKIKDNLTGNLNHTKRKIWEKSVSDVLQLLDIQSGLKSGGNLTPQLDPDDHKQFNEEVYNNKDLWVRYFNEKYGYTKYSSNVLTANQFASGLARYLPDGSPHKIQLSLFCENIEKIKNENPNDHEKRIAEITNQYKKLIRSF